MDAKAFQEDLKSLGFTPSIAKPEMGRKLGEERPAHKMTERNESGSFIGEVETPQ